MAAPQFATEPSRCATPTDGLPLALLADWREPADERISGPRDRYQDLRDRLDPLGDEARKRLARAPLSRLSNRDRCGKRRSWKQE